MENNAAFDSISTLLAAAELYFGQPSSNNCLLSRLELLENKHRNFEKIISADVSLLTTFCAATFTTFSKKHKISNIFSFPLFLQFEKH